MWPRCCLQPCWHSRSLSAGPWAAPGALLRSAIPQPPGPGAPLLRSLCPISHSAGPQPVLPLLCLLLSNQALRAFLLELSLSSTCGLSLCLSISVSILWISACPSVSRPLWPVLPLLCALSPPPALSQDHLPLSPAQRPGGPASVLLPPLRGSAILLPQGQPFTLHPALAPQGPGAHSSQSWKGPCSFQGWEGVRAGVGIAPELPAPTGEVPLV